jgi:hypothetical protein
MGASGKFRHHAAKGRMDIELAEHHVGKDFARPVSSPAHHRGGGFIAACLDSQYVEAAVHPCGVLASVHGACL